MNVSRFVAVVFVGVVTTRLSAQGADPHNAQPERPTVATHAGSVAPRFLEIETGLQLDRLASPVYALSSPSVFKTGVTSNTQLEITVPLIRQPSRTAGVGDVATSFKWRFAEESPLGRLAIQPTAKLPTGSQSTGNGTGTTDLSLLLIASKSLGAAEMDLNVGYTRRSGDGTAAPTNATLWTASFGGPASEQVGWVLEFFGYPKTSGPAGLGSTAAVLGGPTFTARPWLVFDTGVIVPISGSLPHSAYVGLTYNAGRY